MSYFRNFDRVISSKAFTTRNSLCFRSNANRINLCRDQQPCIDHLHSCKALINTINTLKSYRSDMQEGNYSKVLDQEIDMLQNSLFSYKSMVRRFVEAGGNVTAQGLANIYACNNQLNLSLNWLSKYTENLIADKIKHMSYENINDIIEGLKVCSPNSENIPKLKRRSQQLLSTNQKIQYVQRLPNESVQFEYVQDSKSNNELVNALANGRSFIMYSATSVACKAWQSVEQTVFKKNPEYGLHHQ